jgi:hypothetical protein
MQGTDTGKGLYDKCRYREKFVEHDQEQNDFIGPALDIQLSWSDRCNCHDLIVQEKYQVISWITNRAF